MLAELIARAYSRRYPRKTSDQIREEVLSEHRMVGVDVARRFVRGNVNIKAGNFSTVDTIPRVRPSKGE